MPDRCTIADCSRSSRLFCKCCREEFCLPHFSEHHDQVNIRVNQLKLDLNLLREQLQVQRIDQYLHQFRQQMKQWRVESYTIIDQYFDEKCREFTRFVDDKLYQQPEELQRVQQQVEIISQSDNVQQDQLDVLNNRIKAIKEKISQVEQTLGSVVITPLTIIPNTVQIPK